MHRILKRLIELNPNIHFDYVDLSKASSTYPFYVPMWLNFLRSSSIKSLGTNRIADIHFDYVDLSKASSTYPFYIPMWFNYYTNKL